MTRIISGFAGSLRLTVPKSGTRPTSDRVREAIFSTLDAWEMLPGAHVIDLYAGSGALALEAISRGAISAELVEKHAAAAAIANSNAKAVLSAYRSGSKGSAGAGSSRQMPRITTVTRAVSAYLETASVPADIIFIDPPYELSEEALERDLARVPSILTIDGVVLVERSSRSSEPRWPQASEAQAGPTQSSAAQAGQTQSSAQQPGLRLLRRKDYGETVLWWAERSDRPA